MGFTPETLTRDRHSSDRTINDSKLVAHATMERLAELVKGGRVNLVTPKPGASDLFGTSADVVRRLEHIALMLGAMVDLVRELTGYPLTRASACLRSRRSKSRRARSHGRADRAAELKAKWGTEPGQLWQIGPHWVRCADSREKAGVGRLWAHLEPNAAWSGLIRRTA
jgi:hypothetical protein